MSNANNSTPPAGTSGYRDFVGGKTRTWPYGTQKTVDVLETFAYGSASKLVVCKDADAEGYILYGGDGDEFAARAGDKGTITFTRGGPTGGYWKYSVASPDNR